jgi:hypothetical protein
MTNEKIIQNIKTRRSTLESYDPAEYALNKGILFELKDLLSMIEKDKPSLPSGFDKAAIERMRDPDMYLSDATIEEIGDALLKMAHFGAEWIAGQGYTFETTMQEDDLGELVPTCPDMYNHGYSCGDKVMVQIRKK